MGNYGFLQYLRLKITVSLIRAVIAITGPSKKDQELAKATGTNKQRIRVPSRDQERFLNADLYYPPGHSQSSPPAEKLPVVINWHGSGFSLPIHGYDVLYCSRLARDAGVFVIDADYRKGPEAPYPGPLQDVEDVLSWVATQSERFDVSRVAVSGFSAGGNLALVAASSLRKKPTDLNIRAVVASYPPTDMSIAPEARQVPNPKNAYPPWMIRMIYECYVPDAAVRKNPAVSPAFAEPDDFPSTVAIVTCEGDTFGPEAIALARKLEGGDRTVIHTNLKDTHHAFDKGCKEGSGDWKQREEMYTLLISTLKGALAV